MGVYPDNALVEIFRVARDALIKDLTSMKAHLVTTDELTDIVNTVMVLQGVVSTQKYLPEKIA